MRNLLIKIFSRPGDIKISRKLRKFVELSSIYTQLVKSSIVSALIIDTTKLIPSSAPSEQQYALMLALCAYFAARTDYELEIRSVNQSARDMVWPHIFDAVLAEMHSDKGLSIVEIETLRLYYNGQVGTMAGACRSKSNGFNDVDLLCTILVVLISTPDQNEAKDFVPVISICKEAVVSLLNGYLNYTPVLDNLAKLGSKINIT